MFIIVVIIAIIRINRRKKLHSSPFNFDEMLEDTKNMNLITGVRIPREIRRDAVKIISTLGKGNFGEVSKGLLTETRGVPGVLVAIKVLHQHGAETADARESLLLESSIMAQFDHDNVVRLFGVVTVYDPLLVILEYCEQGSLSSFLEKNNTELVVKLQIASDCAKGMTYLASLNFVHRDLAARNVLLGSDMNAKIADFGLSRETHDKQYYVSRGGALPIRWTAPEALEQNKFSEQSDIWAFGILLYEIWTRAALPYADLSNERVWVKVLEGYRMSIPFDCPDLVYDVIKSCWLDYGQRPKFAEIAVFLSEMYENMITSADSIPANRVSFENAAFQRADSSMSSVAVIPRQSTLSYMVPDSEIALNDPHEYADEDGFPEDINNISTEATEHPSSGISHITFNKYAVGIPAQNTTNGAASNVQYSTANMRPATELDSKPNVQSTRSQSGKWSVTLLLHDLSQKSHAWETDVDRDVENKCIKVMTE